MLQESVSDRALRSLSTSSSILCRKVAMAIIQLRRVGGVEPSLKKAVPAGCGQVHAMQAQAGGGQASLHKEGQGMMIEAAALSMVRQEPADHQLKPLQQQYTSLRDLIAASPPTPTRRAPDIEWFDAEELEFKDKLLKLAARAYLQPIVRKSVPKQTHFIAQCWVTFASTNKSLVVGIIDSLQRQADACLKFLRTQTFNLVQRFKSQQHASFLQ